MENIGRGFSPTRILESMLNKLITYKWHELEYLELGMRLLHL